MIGNSYQPTAATHNVENLGLEPVWPYGVIGDNTVVNGDNLTALADRTYSTGSTSTTRTGPTTRSRPRAWTWPPRSPPTWWPSTESYQVYPSGLAAWNPGTLDEPYIEQVSNVAATLDEALATDYDGTVRFAPAWPSGWDGVGHACTSRAARRSTCRSRAAPWPPPRSRPAPAAP